VNKTKLHDSDTFVPYDVIDRTGTSLGWTSAHKDDFSLKFDTSRDLR
jgi:hypothetical protein